MSSAVAPVRRIPAIFKSATWRNTTRVDENFREIGIGFTLEDGSIIRLRLNLESARHVKETIEEYCGAYAMRVQSPTEFIDSVNDALGEVVRRLGGPKKVGEMLKRELTIRDSSNWVTACLNPDRREHFTPEQVQLLIREARKVGCHAAINFMCADAGYSNPQPIDPEDEKAKLQREFIEATKQQTRNIERLEQLAKSNG